MTWRSKAIAVFGLAMLSGISDCRAHTADTSRPAIHQMLLFLEKINLPAGEIFLGGYFPLTGSMFFILMS